jgi:hypothetical protein
VTPVAIAAIDLVVARVPFSRAIERARVDQDATPFIEFVR